MKESMTYREEPRSNILAYSKGEDVPYFTGVTGTDTTYRSCLVESDFSLSSLMLLH
jgi:hypothetical protein